MDEAALCDRVALIQKGSILDIDAPKRIIERFPRKIIRVRSNDMFRLIKDLRAYEKAESAFAFGQFVHFTGVNDDVKPSDLEDYLHTLNHTMVETEEIQPEIEDVFMSLQQQ